ncbi:MAG: hypothetical protein IKN38_02035 [Clostridia bacterium]|nr:hypothetical protein [Clostridia bacterium]
MKAKRLTVLLLVSAILLSLLIYGFIKFRSMIMGSPECVIASDYTSLVLFGKKYVPIKTGDAVCIDNEKIIEEARVEGETFIGKLLFGDWVYSVCGSDDFDIIHLYTEYDDAAEYYCVEDKVNYYSALLHGSEYNELSAEIIKENWDGYEISLDAALSDAAFSFELSDMSDSVDCCYSRADGDECVEIYALCPGNPFRWYAGEFLRKSGEYYWHDCGVIHPKNYKGTNVYAMDDKYDKELDAIFERMFK